MFYDWIAGGWNELMSFAQYKIKREAREAMEAVRSDKKWTEKND